MGNTEVRATMDYQIFEIHNEPVSEQVNGAWQLVTVEYENGETERKYFHLDCDCVTDNESRCMLCGARAF